MELHVEYFQVSQFFSSAFYDGFVCVCVCVLVQTQWMAAPLTVMETASVWPDTATASLDSWVLTVPKVRDIR